MRSREIYIIKIGMYNLFFIFCDLKLKGLVMNGRILWKNFDGYLFGRMVLFMNFYVFMFIVYFLFCVIWFF